jgi:predicted nuclease with RNAse H fold
VTAADVKQKTEAIERERAAKLKELEERSALKVSLALAAAVWVEAPVTIAAVRVRRRKLDRELRWEFDAATGQLLPLACEGCRGPADAPAFCDDRVHAICSGCVPRAEGRWDCPACRHKPG